MLFVIKSAYREFEDRLGRTKSPRGEKTGMILNAIEGKSGEFTMVELEMDCPGVSRDMVRAVLRDLKNKGQVECIGRGPGARWRKRGNTLKKR